MKQARRPALALLALLAVAAASAPASGEPVFRPTRTADASLNSENQSWGRHLHDALRLPDWIDLAVDQRTRLEILTEPFRPGERGTDVQFPQRTRLRVGADAPAPLRWLLELEDARTWNDGPGDFTRNEIDELDVLQLFVSATARDVLGSGLDAEVAAGRFTLDVGSRRLVARNRFRNTTNSFQGGHAQLAGAAWRVRAFFTLPVIREEDPFDDLTTTDERLWGVVYEEARVPCLLLEAYYLDLDDDDAEQHLHTFGVRAYRPARPGGIDYEVELMPQFGDTGPDDQSAFATHAEVGYTLAVAWSPQLLAQFDYASGTADPGGRENHTFSPLFGARRFDLVPTGIFGPFARSNILSPGVRVVLAPARGMRAHVKIRYWQLAEAKDQFVGTGLQDPTGAAGRDLGTDVEVAVNWDPLPYLGIELGYDYWFKGSYLQRVPDVPSLDDSSYVYVATRFRF